MLPIPDSLRETALTARQSKSKMDRVYVRYSPELHAVQFNYSPEAIFAGIWTPEEQVSRGLILCADKGDVVARPFDKFWNWGEDGRMTESPLVGVAEKMDGSLGIVFHRHGQWRVVTRGSFDNEQSVWATRWIQERDMSSVPTDLTLLCEIIYPDNRIVVGYEFSGLVLLDVRTKEGLYLPPTEVDNIATAADIRPVPRHEIHTLDELLHTLGDSRDREGVVAKFQDGSIFKFKTLWYFGLHRLVTSTTKKSVGAAMLDGSLAVVRSLFDGDESQTAIELKTLVSEWEQEIRAEAREIEDQVEEVWKLRPREVTRKELALWVIRDHKDVAKYIFALDDGAPIGERVLADVIKSL